MRINLLEIPKEGKTFVLNRRTGELNEYLRDLIGNTEYSTEFDLRPLDTGFELVGRIKTEIPEQCSRCGLDFDQSVDAKFHELLFPKMGLERNDKYAKSNHFSDVPLETGPSIVEYEGHHFEVSEYLHETVALELGTQPAPKADCDGNCVLCHEKVEGRSFGYQEDFPSKKESPFASLKTLKIN